MGITESSYISNIGDSSYKSNINGIIYGRDSSKRSDSNDIGESSFVSDSMYISKTSAKNKRKTVIIYSRVVI